MVALTRWAAEPYFWTSVALPALIALLAAARNRREVAANAGVWLVATIVTVASAYSDLRGLFGLPPDPYGVYALPIFPVLYLVAGRYPIANASVCFAGTFASLLATDLAVYGQQWLVQAGDATDTMVGIGAGQPVDGLVIAPVGAWVAAWLVARLQRRGVPMRIFRPRISG